MTARQFQYMDAVVVLDRPRHLIGNDSSRALFKAITKRDVTDYDFSETADIRDAILGLTTLLFAMARETDPTVEATTIAGAITPKTLPRILNQLSAACERGKN